MPKHFELPSNSRNSGNGEKHGGLPKGFYKIGEQRSIPSDKLVTEFWNAQALVKQPTPDTSVRVVQSTDTRYPTAQDIFRAVNPQQLKRYGLYQSQVADTLKKVSDAIASSPRIQATRRIIYADDALEILYADDDDKWIEDTKKANTSRALKLLEEFDKLTREAREGKEYQEFCESQHVDTDIDEKYRRQSFELIEHQIGMRVRDSIIERLGFIPEDHEARVKETLKLLDNYRKYISDTKGSFAMMIKDGKNVDERELVNIAYMRHEFVNNYQLKILGAGKNLTD